MISETTPTLLVVIASSTGQGELPPNGAQFLSKIEKVKLHQTDFCMLCLGDSNYTTFMDGPHGLLKAMLRAGMRLVDQIVEADDSNNDAFADATDKFIEGIECLVRKWVNNELTQSVEPVFHPLSSTSQKAKQASQYDAVIELIRRSDHVAASTALKIPKMPEPAFEIATDDSQETYSPPQNFSEIQNGAAFEPVSSPIYECTVLNGKRLTSVQAEKQAWEISLSLPESTRCGSDNGRELHCGDCVALFTPNDPKEVDLAMKAFGGTDVAVFAKGGKRPSWFPERASLKNLLEYHVELRTPVSKTMLGHLMNSCSSSDVKRRLGEFVSREGKEIYRALLDNQVTFVDLLVAFPQLSPKLSILAYLKRLQRRWYSIANWIDYSQAVDSRVIRIAFTEVSLPKPGLMTNQLARIIDNLKEHDAGDLPFGPCRNKVILECRDPPPNMFRLDETPNVPILMIAAGSGIAPFIGFLEKIASIDGKEASLIFGCRNEHSHIYKDSMQKRLEEGTLKNLWIAMSREGNKKYVQDILLGMWFINES